jgi:hypothetical protein
MCLVGLIRLKLAKLAGWSLFRFWCQGPIRNSGKQWRGGSNSPRLTLKSL